MNAREILTMPVKINRESIVSLKTLSQYLIGMSRDKELSMQDYVKELSFLVNYIEFRGIGYDLMNEEPLQVNNKVAMSHMGGVAEYLSQISGTMPPDWCLNSRYFLKDPYYAGAINEYQILLTYTPTSFRRRNIFSGKNLGFDLQFRTH